MVGYDRYTDIVLRYQDTVVGQHYGHMNVDALFIQEDSAAMRTLVPANETDTDTVLRSDLTNEVAAEHIEASEDEDLRAESLSADLRHDFKTLPGEARTNLDLYHAFFAAPSIVP